MKDVVEFLTKKIDDDLKPKRDKAYELKDKVSDKEQARKLSEMYTSLSRDVDRLALCIDILSGRSFVYKDDVVGIKVTVPEIKNKKKVG